MTEQAVMVKMVLDRWNSLLRNCDECIQSLRADQLEKEIAPGKNRGIYLLGHLIATHDDLFRLLEIGEPLHGDLFEMFVKAPDKAVKDIPSVDRLKEVWGSQVALLTSMIGAISPDEWFGKHSAVSEADFEKEPHRNKLNVILTRTTHLSYHLGQLKLL